MLRSSLYSLVWLSLAAYTRAAGTFVGCILVTELLLASDSTQRTTSNSACQSRCSTTGFAYSYYVAGVLTGNNCYCDGSASYVGAAAYVLPVGGILSGDQACIAGLQATATKVSTTFVFSNCVGTLTGVSIDLLTGQILGGALVDSPGACFERCKGNLNAYFIPIIPSVTTVLPSYGCVCNPSGVGSSILCGVGQFYRFNHDASASGMARRRLQEAMKAETTRRASFCPGQMQACNIEGAEDSWECVDPLSDLESCGGCAYGDYNAKHLNSTATGEDCTTLPGIRLGGTTCTRGRCEVFSCKRGWVLVNGRCEKK